MKARHSLALSALFHAAIVTAVLTFNLPEEKEEEIVLELSLNAPDPTDQTIPQPAPQLTPDTSSRALRQPQPQTTQAVLPVDPSSPAEVPSTVPLPAEPSRDVAQAPTPAEPDPMIATGPAVPHPPPPEPLSAEQEYLDRHLASIRDLLLKYRKYPTQAVRMKQEGRVRVSFRLNRSGEVDEITILSSSGHAVLDEATIALIQKTALYFPKPPKPVRITIPLHYQLS